MSAIAIGGTVGTAARSARMLASIALMFSSVYGAIWTLFFVTWPSGGRETADASACVLAAMLLWPWPQRGRLTALLLAVAWGWVGLLAMAGAVAASWAWIAFAARVEPPEALRRVGRGQSVCGVPLRAAACVLSILIALALDEAGVLLSEPLWSLIQGGFEPVNDL